MKEMIEFFLPIEPRAQPRPRFSRKGFAYNTKASRKYRDDLVALSKIYAPPAPFTGPVSIVAVFLMPRRSTTRASDVHHIKKPDIDNLYKALADALEGPFIQNDSQICITSLTKEYAKPGCSPGIAVSITPIDPNHSLRKRFRCHSEEPC